MAKHRTWQRVPSAPPGCDNGVSWVCLGSNIMLVATTNVGWCAVDARDPRPYIVIDGRKLYYCGVFNGSWAMSSSASGSNFPHTLAYYPGIGWAYKESGFSSPKTWLDYDGTTRLGDDYWTVSSTYMPDNMPHGIARASQRTVTLTGHGPTAEGTSLTGTWYWPRLQPASRIARTASPAGTYDTAVDGWTGVGSVIVGNATFSAGSRGTLSVSADGTSCGPATLQNGTWAIGTIGSGAWLQTSDDLRTCDNGDTVSWSPQHEAGYDGDELQSESWTCSGRTIGDETARIWVGDCARWL